MKKITLAAVALSFIMGPMAFATTSTTSDQTTTTPSTTSDQMKDKMGSGCPHKERMKEMMQSLNLDSSQQAKIKAIKDQLRQSQQSNMQQMKSIRSQIHDLITSGTMDESKLNSLIDQKKELLGQMIKAKIKAKQQIYNVLNDQQKSQFKQMLQQWEQNKGTQS
ncbi:Spy/CpxP family protein refolding chaperone [Legionella lansingensis]|nr:Spy/CpxP family protein refolding chaperone [Legionella lansingensis]